MVQEVRTHNMATDDEGTKDITRSGTGIKLFFAVSFLVILIIVSVVMLVVVKKEEVVSPTQDPMTAILDTLNNALDGKPDIKLTNFTNWDQRTSKPNVFVARPSTVEEIQNVIKEAKKSSLRVRAMGSAYSFSDLFADEGQLVLETAGITTLGVEGGGEAMRIVLLDDGTRLVEVAAGVTLGQLIRFMQNNDVMMRALPTAKNIRVGGIIGTGSHGTSVHRGSPSDYLWGASLVDADGEKREYNSIQHSEQMTVLRNCLGMCGIIYQLAIKVEPLKLAWADHLFVRSRELFDDPDRLRELTSSTDALMFWAPLSSVNATGWTYYGQTGLIPLDYESMDDFVWIKSVNVTELTEKPLESRLKRDVTPPTILTSPPLITGSHYHPEKANDKSSVTNMLSEEQPQYVALNEIHKVAWDYTYGLFGNLTSILVTTPTAVVTVDGDDQAKIYSTAFNFPEGVNFSTTRHVMQIVLSKLEEEAHAGRMPVLTLELAWLKTNKECDLCFTNHRGADYAFTLDIVGASYKPEYPAFINKTITTLQEEFPTMRVEWAKMPKSLDGLHDFVRKSASTGIQKFKQFQNATMIDSSEMFTNANLRQMFYY